MSEEIILLGVQVADAERTVIEVLDITQLPPTSGGVVPSSTWYVLFVHHDLPQAGGLTLTDSSSRGQEVQAAVRCGYGSLE